MNRHNIKILFFKALSLKEELIWLNDKYSSIVHLYEKEFNKTNDDKNNAVKFEKKLDCNENSNENSNAKNLRKVISNFYKKMVKNLHPDKIKDKKLNDYFVKIADAKSNNNLLDILETYYNINNDFNITDNLDDIVAYLKADIEFKENRINAIKNSLPIKWYDNLEK